MASGINGGNSRPCNVDHRSPGGVEKRSVLGSKEPSGSTTPDPAVARACGEMLAGVK